MSDGFEITIKALIALIQDQLRDLPKRQVANAMVNMAAATLTAEGLTPEQVIEELERLVRLARTAEITEGHA